MEHYERINYLSKINTSEYYLEIGVDNGFTFTQVDISHKTGVDPHFFPDSTTILKKSRSGGTLRQTTSDDFFLSIPADYIYDFVFIDGLHTWDQTYQFVEVSFSLYSLRDSRDSCWFLMAENTLAG